MSGVAPATRLYVLLARESPKAVIFRRGPSRQVLLLTWNTETDEIAEGQWFRGRIYERRCDLSPDGERLVYFAAKYREPYFTWSAISRPPAFTALALWPKGDAWGGGGLFESPTRLALNHRASEMHLADGFSLPPDLDVVPLGEWSGRGEDDPIWSTRLTRDGWTRTSEGRIHRSSVARLELDPPLIWEKPGPHGHTLEMRIRAIAARNGPHYLTDHHVVSPSRAAIDLPGADWADWSRKGDLLFSRGGTLWRMAFADGGLGEAREILDLSNRTFRSVDV